MKSLLRTFASVAGTALLTQALAAAELVNNGGFEQGLNDWSFGGVGSFLASPTRVHSGSAGLEIYSPLDNHGFVYQTLNTQVGQEYVLNFWLLSSDFDPFFQASFNGVPLLTINSPVGLTWVQQTITFIGTGPAVLQFEQGFENGGFWALDDISVTPARVQPVPESGTTLGILGVALIAVSFFRRRRA